ncbi:MAG: TonB C-terminal domain-containing protein [Cyanobacteria bacterium SZAS LIN-5]|nr:TonB C-terminal domain-containing protein [Cyanobacteria bacterium SZAS LIN-5]RTL44730.1 MAG: TonB C-terminal domain-containing protein [Candidatus Melainabacteria bacterium]
MTSTAKPPGFHQSSKDPNMAAMLSIIPGFGQLYNGEQRKGMLFLAVAAINFIVFLLLLFTDPILRGLVEFGISNHMKPNRELVTSISQIHMGSPASLVVLGLFLSFVAFAIRDAYDHAALLQRRRIYPEYVMAMSEATSGSYLLHVAFMASFFVLAFFFLVPPPPKQQITDIEFIQNQPPVEHKVKSQRHAQKNSENAGKHDATKPVTAPSPAPKAPSKAAPAAKPTPEKAAPTPKPTPTPSPKPTPTPVARPTPTPPSPHPSPSPTPHPSPTPSPSPTPTPSPTPKPMAMPTPTPFAHPSASPSPTPSPSPSPLAFAHGGGPSLSPVPKIGAGPGHGSTAAPAPAPMSTGSGAAGGGPPSPSPIAGGGAPRVGGGSGPTAAPAPSRVGRSGGGGSAGGGPIAVAPSVPRPTGGGGGEGVKGNPDANNNPNGRPSVAAQADVDFGPYMADLQRRIKRAWFPPKGNESKRVVVIFKVHRGGELSNLRLDKSSGVAIADQAALKAVENAAPFRPLPAGASDDVDIQFTFDYNVFSGGGHGTFRSF